MPIIQNYSDKHKIKVILLSALYLLLAVAAVSLLFKLFVQQSPTDPNSTDLSKVDRNICFEKDVEQYIVDKVDGWTVENEQYKTTEVTSATECNVVIRRNTEDPNNLIKLFDTTYVLISRDTQDEIESLSQEELLDALVTQSYQEHTLVWDLTTDSFLRSNFNIGVGQIVLSDEEIERRLASANYIAVVNSASTQDGDIVLSIDNQNPTTEGYNSAKYPLIDRYWIGGDNEDDIATIYGILVEQSETQE